MLSEQEPLFNNGVPPENIPDAQPEEKQDDEDQNLVVATKVSSRVKGLNMKRIFEELNKQQATTSVIPPPPVISHQQSLKREMSFKQKISATQKEKEKKKQGFGKISEEAMANANTLLDYYKLYATNRFVCDVAQKARSQIKEKLVLYLLYGIQELKVSDVKLNDIEQSLIDKQSKDQVDYIKRIVNEIQLNLIRHHNKLQKNKIQRGYKDRANLILVNLKDQANAEIRNKVLNNKMTPEMLSTARQIDFYTTAKRQQMIAKSRNLMAQNTLQFKTNAQDNQMQVQTIRQQKQQKQKVQQPKLKIVDDKLSTQITDLMTKHIDGFYNKYKRDLPTDECQLLCSHLDLVFVGR